MSKHLSDFSTDDLKKELRFRTGINHLTDKIRAINIVLDDMQKLTVARRLIDAKANELNRGGTYDGHFPVVPEAEELITKFKDLVYDTL